MQRHFARRRGAGFTLVELLVVIAILGILTALITVAANKAMVAAKRTRVKAEVDQLAAAFKSYKTKYGSYPPNWNWDTSSSSPTVTSASQTYVRRHLLKAFPRISSYELNAIASANLTPAEAAWFWLNGFTPDPTRPVSGAAIGTPLFEFDKTRLVPTRSISIDPDGSSGSISPVPVQLYKYKPQGTDLTEPYVYFDMSRSYARPLVYPIKNPAVYTNTNVLNGQVGPYPGVSDKLQVLAAGLDNNWGSAPKLAFPDGPYLQAEADNLASFSTKSMGDSMP